MRAPLKKDMRSYILPTFTTAPGRDYRQAVDAVRAAIAAGVTGILGLHLEGPFLSRERPGIHHSEFIRPLDEEDIELLCGAASELKILLTLAPECQEPKHLRRLSEAGIVLFAGHSASTAEQMATARENGVSGATHLFNAMSPISGRAPGIVGEVLGSRRGYAGIIADGFHVDPLNLSLAAHALPDGLCLVTDAMQTLEGRRTSFDLYGKSITLKDGRLTGPDGTLGGAHLSMDAAVRNMGSMTGTDLGKIFQMASTNPSECLGLGGKLGYALPGYKASLTLLSSDLVPTGVITDGCLFKAES